MASNGGYRLAYCERSSTSRRYETHHSTDCKSVQDVIATDPENMAGAGICAST
jgi:hypothetical protein